MSNTNTTNALTTVPVINGVMALEDLARRINDEHDQCAEAARSTLDHALNAGALLTQAKGQIPHGQWGNWLRAHCTVSERTAQLYMKLARAWPAWLEAHKTATIADLSMTQAVALLAAPARTGADESADLGPAAGVDTGRSAVPRWYLLAWPLEERARVCQQWWDQCCPYTFLLDTEGLPAPEIAQVLGVSLEQVQRILSPQPPSRFHILPEAGMSMERVLFDGGAVPAYTALVEDWILSWQMQGYQSAANLAEIEKPALVAPLRSLSAHYKRRREDLQASPAWGSFWSQPDFSDTLDDFSVPFWSCALGDARIAVGVEPDMGRTLSQLWAEVSTELRAG